MPAPVILEGRRVRLEPLSLSHVTPLLRAATQRRDAESKLLTLGHAFDTWGVLRVTLKTDSRNCRSRRAIERIGARFEGIRRAHARAVDGSIRDTAYYSILATEWPAVRTAFESR